MLIVLTRTVHAPSMTNKRERRRLQCVYRYHDKAPANGIEHSPRGRIVRPQQNDFVHKPEVNTYPY